jgi:DNA-binding FrmR family transcriptional regulator
MSRRKSKAPQSAQAAQGQIDALERAIDGDVECARVLQQATACRGALEGFIAEVIEDHIREHMIEPDLPVSDPKVQAAEELVAIVRSYLR